MQLKNAVQVSLIQAIFAFNGDKNKTKTKKQELIFASCGGKLNPAVFCALIQFLGKTTFIVKLSYLIANQIKVYLIIHTTHFRLTLKK